MSYMPTLLAVDALLAALTLDWRLLQPSTELSGSLDSIDIALLVPAMSPAPLAPWVAAAAPPPTRPSSISLVDLSLLVGLRGLPGAKKLYTRSRDGLRVPLTPFAEVITATGKGEGDGGQLG